MWGSKEAPLEAVTTNQANTFRENEKKYGLDLVAGAKREYLQAYKVRAVILLLTYMAGYNL